MMDIRKRIFIAIGIIIGLVLAFLLFYFFVLKPTGEDQQEEGITPTTTEQDIEQEVMERLTPDVQSTLEAEPFSEETYVKQVSEIFVERFGTYSNQNDNQHIEDVLPLVTDQMANWLSMQDLDQSKDYVGVTTKVIASSVEQIDEDSATVLVEAQRITETTLGEEKENLSGSVDLVKINDDWKIDGLYWD
ncbi:MAG: hypothetical protein GF349_04225 [Candidatus Magasanikbacteria bacterium]|nr:hypothetical protein [Candidatus Magasanikbacteria bacterium]